MSLAEGATCCVGKSQRTQGGGGADRPRAPSGGMTAKPPAWRIPVSAWSPAGDDTESRWCHRSPAPARSGARRHAFLVPIPGTSRRDASAPGTSTSRTWHRRAERGAKGAPVMTHSGASTAFQRRRLCAPLWSLIWERSRSKSGHEREVARNYEASARVQRPQFGRPNCWRSALSNSRAGMRRRSRLTCFATLPTG